MKHHEKLAAALSKARKAADQRSGQIIYTNDLSRADRELLLKTGWLEEIIKGWYMLVRADVMIGNSSAWYTNYWDFVRIYLKHRFDENYCLSAESSLDLHIDISTMPQQIVVVTLSGGSSTLRLPHNMSILMYEDRKNFPVERELVRGIQVIPLASALCKVSSAYFQKNVEDAEIALRMVNPTALINAIMKQRTANAGERLIGAYRFLRDEQVANNIEASFNAQKIPIKPYNPFTHNQPFTTSPRPVSPYVARIESIWEKGRHQIINLFPAAPGLPSSREEYLQAVEEIYVHDAYNSLSIEGYQVNHNLIERVENNEWDPQQNIEDKTELNALAARGYYEAFHQVKKSIEKILSGDLSGTVFENDLQTWYLNLFGPSVRAKLIGIEQLVGYRNDQVYIRGSRHTPLQKNALMDAMGTLFKCLKEEKHASVRAVLGHQVFVYIHPYMDGNGRIARFLMNCMFASGGYPWTIIRVEDRDRYFAALEEASVKQDFVPFTKFVLEQMNKPLPGSRVYTSDD